MGSGRDIVPPPTADAPRGRGGQGSPIDRYSLDTPLRDEGTRSSFLATDPGTGEQVVVKRVRGWIPPRTDVRLRYEAEAAAQAGLPGLIPFTEVHRGEDELTLVRPYVSGQALSERLEEGPMPSREALGILLDVLDILEAGHRKGIIHRALRPSNVILPAEDDHQIHLVDVGLSSGASESSLTYEMPADLAIYASPEGAGLIEHEIGEWSDLYQVGLILFEALAGHPPFQGEELSAVLRQHMTAEPPSLRAEGVDVSSALDQVVNRLLRKAPRERYRSVQGVRVDLEAILNALVAGEDEPDVVIGAHDRRTTLTEPGFIGRQDELARLEARLADTQAGQGGVVLLEAESGGGKTRLLDELAQATTIQGAWVLRGQGLDAAAQRPFQILRGMADGIVQRARKDPELADELSQALGTQAKAVAEALPGMADVLGVETTEATGPEAFGEVRTVQALSRLLDALGSPDEPALILIDDCQWADTLSLRLLRTWADHPPDGPRHALLVASFRAEEVDQDSPLRNLDPVDEIRLDPLGSEAIQRLVESMAGPVPEPGLQAVVRLADGNPFMASAVLRGLIEAGALRPQPSGWAVDDAALSETETSRHAAAFLVRRLELLPEATQELLTVGAIIGKEFDLPMAAALADLPAGQALSAMEPARRRRVVWPTDVPGRYQFAHDKLREAVLSNLDDAVRRDLHQAAALHLEDQQRDRPFDLAFHYDAAGHPEKALPHALPAAEEARARYALRIAEQYYRIASRGVPDDDEATRYRIAMGLGDVLMLQGDYEDAQAPFQAALDLAATDRERAEARGKLGELAFKRGDMASSAREAEAALRTLGERVPRSTVGYLFLLIWEVMIQTFHSLMPGLTTERRSLGAGEEDLRATRLYSRLTYVYWYHKGPIPTLWAHLREMNLAERYPPTPERSQAYAEHAPVMTQLPWFARGEAYARRAITIAQEAEDPYAEGAARHFLGLVLYAAGDLQGALDTLRRGERLLNRTGDRWQANNAGFHIAFCHYRLGDLRQAVEKAKRVHETAEEIGDLSTLGLALEVWAKASDGDVPERLIDAGLGKIPRSDAQTYESALQAEAIVQLNLGRYDQAAETLAAAAEVAADAGLRSEYVAPIPAWQATVHRRHAEATSSLLPSNREALVSKAKAAVRRARWMAWAYPNNRPHVLRERGLLAAMEGHARRAERLLEESLATAQDQGAAAEALRTRRALARLATEQGREASQPRLAEAQEALEARLPGPQPTEQRPEASLSLVDRFAGLLRLGRQIASTLAPDVVHQSAREAAAVLLRAQEVAILDAEGDDPSWEPLAGHLSIPPPEDLIRTALDLGGPVTFSDEELGEVDEALIRSGARSALCAPISVADQPAAVLVAVHHDISGLFQEDDERIAAFLTTIAGASLESARNYRELQHLNETLELRVADRTAELEAQTEKLQRSNQELAEALDELEHALSLQEATLDATADGLLVVDLDGEIVAYNQQFQEMWGIPDEVIEQQEDQAAIGHVMEQLEDPGSFVEQIEAVYGEPEAISRDMLEFKDGRIYERYSRPQRLDGEVVGRVWSFRDVTEERQAKRELERSNEELQQFAYVVSHDLQEPLRMVSSYLSLIERRYGDQLDEEAHEFIAYAVDGANRMRQLIQDLLAYARLGTQAEPFEPTDLDQTVREVVQGLQMTIDEADGEVTWQGLPTIQATPSQMRQLFQNLLSNAIKFAHPDRPPRVDVQAEDEGDAWHLTLSDNGIGIPEDKGEEIFVVFQRLHGAQLYPGTGIGLAICKRIAERHDGEIWVDSRQGEGSTFHVRLAKEPKVEDPYGDPSAPGGL